MQETLGLIPVLAGYRQENQRLLLGYRASSRLLIKLGLYLALVIYMAFRVKCPSYLKPLGRGREEGKKGATEQERRQGEPKLAEASSAAY